MKILLTGGAGYVGTELARLLVARDEVEKVLIYDNLSRANYNLFLGAKPTGYKKIEFVKSDILDSRSLKKAMKGTDVVYHLAAKVTTPFAHADQHSYEQVNHWGTAEVVYAAEESKVKKFIYASSAGVYGSTTNPVDEQTPPNPQTFYAISKWRGEEHVRRLLDKMDTYIFRCGNVYGYSKSMRFDAVINKFVFEANFNKRITIQGDGRQSRSFIHIDLLAAALSQVLDTTLPGGLYNLMEKNLEVIEVVDQLKQLIPDLEFILLDQHIKLHNLQVKKNDRANNILGINQSWELKEELSSFLEKFSF